jgi:hypothetical protein
VSEKDNSANKKALIVVGGAFSYIEKGPKKSDVNPLLSLATIGFRLFQQTYSEANKRIYGALGSVAANTELIIPNVFGVFQLEQTYADVEAQMLEKIASYPEGTDVYAAGFSLGGTIIARFTSLYPDIVKRSISIAGPHHGARFLGFGPTHFDPFLEQTADLRSDLGNDAPPIDFIGSMHDGLVPINSSLPTPFPHIKTEQQKAIGNLFTNHLIVARHPETLQACRDIMEIDAA